MFKISLFIVAILLLGFSVDAQETEYEYRAGVYTEIKPDSSNHERYTEDNVIYKAGNIYYFDYHFFDKSGTQYYYHDSIYHGKEWTYVPLSEITDSTVVGFQITVLPDLGRMGRHNPNYNQTVIEYKYVMKNGHIIKNGTSTGLVENVKNIWMHPPRKQLFKILQLNPFPFIQVPFEKGNTFSWGMLIGAAWGDSRWREWDGAVENQSYYEITDIDVIMETAFGELNCYKVESFAESELGNTFLTSYFNDIYGFVRLEYTNIDSSKIVINLKNAKIR